MAPKLIQKLTQLVLLTTIWSSVALADEPKITSLTQEIYQEVLSPFCPGRALQDCPSPNADRLRKEIKDQIESGESKEAVLEGLFKKYGDSISSVPRNQGFGRLAWMIPVIFFGIGALILGIWIKSNISGRSDQS